MVGDTFDPPDSKPKLTRSRCAMWRVDLLLGAEPAPPAGQPPARGAGSAPAPESSDPRATPEVASARRQRYELHLVGHHPRERERIGMPDPLAPGYLGTYTPSLPYIVDGRDTAARPQSEVPAARIYALRPGLHPTPLRPAGEDAVDD